MEKKDILEVLIQHYAGGNKARFAKYLGVSPQAVSTWLSRNTFDVDKVYAKCVDLSAEWLLTGKGEMLKENNNIKVHAHTHAKDKDMMDVVASQQETIATLVGILKDTFSVQISCKSNKKDT